MKIDLEKLKLSCQRCGYRWIPKKIDVRQCPKCKSAYWETKKGEK